LLPAASCLGPCQPSQLLLLLAAALLLVLVWVEVAMLLLLLLLPPPLLLVSMARAAARPGYAATSGAPIIEALPSNRQLLRCSLTVVASCLSCSTSSDSMG
jgi:hypothetical protein